MGFENTYGFSYHSLIDASTGEKGDLCVLTDYSEFLAEMVQSSKTEDPVFPLNRAASEILSVTVNDELVETYTLAEDRMTIRIDGLEPGVEYAIAVEYD